LRDTTLEPSWSETEGVFGHPEGSLSEAQTACGERRSECGAGLTHIKRRTTHEPQERRRARDGEGFGLNRRTSGTTPGLNP